MASAREARGREPFGPRRVGEVAGDAGHERVLLMVGVAATSASRHIPRLIVLAVAACGPRGESRAPVAEVSIPAAGNEPPTAEEPAAEEPERPEEPAGLRLVAKECGDTAQRSIAVLDVDEPLPLVLAPGDCLTVVATGADRLAQLALVLDAPDVLPGISLALATASADDEGNVVLGGGPNCVKNPFQMALPSKLRVENATAPIQVHICVRNG
jgi:hypothetical protein